MAWTIDYSDSARQQLRKLDRQSARRILDYMDERVAALADPREAGKPLKGTLGTFWRYRVGELRIVCDIQDGHMRVLVIRAGHRREVYR